MNRSISCILTFEILHCPAHVLITTRSYSTPGPGIKKNAHCNRTACMYEWFLCKYFTWVQIWLICSPHVSTFANSAMQAIHLGFPIPYKSPSPRLRMWMRTQQNITCKYPGWVRSSHTMTDRSSRWYVHASAHVWFVQWFRSVLLWLCSLLGQTRWLSTFSGTAVLSNTPLLV